MLWSIVGKYIGGILGGLMVAWIIYTGLIRPTTKPPVTSRQEAETITNYTISPKVTFGCMRLQVNKGDD